MQVVSEIVFSHFLWLFADQLNTISVHSLQNFCIRNIYMVDCRTEWLRHFNFNATLSPVQNVFVILLILPALLRHKLEVVQKNRLSDSAVLGSCFLLCLEHVDGKTYV